MFPKYEKQARPRQKGGKNPMNVRKPVDYSAMFSELDKLVAADLPQMGCTVR